MAAVEFEAAAAGTAPFLQDKKLEEAVQGRNTAVGWKMVEEEGWIGCSLVAGYKWVVQRAPVVLGNRELVVHVEAEFVEIAFSPRDTHSAETA